MTEKYEIVGSCSKFIQGRGWVVQVTEKQLNTIGFVKAQPIKPSTDAAPTMEKKI